MTFANKNIVKPSKSQEEKKTGLFYDHVTESFSRR